MLLIPTNSKVLETMMKALKSKTHSGTDKCSHHFCWFVFDSLLAGTLKTLTSLKITSSGSPWIAKSIGLEPTSPETKQNINNDTLHLPGYYFILSNFKHSTH